MTHLKLPHSRDGRRLPFYLAMEEWAANMLPAGDYFFTWRVNPTVIIGRNQDIESEVDLAYCREHGIDVVRRKSGGGCVYADLDNIMLSCITPETDVERTFHAYAQRIAEALRLYGLDAEATGRNDILASGRKISGNAFYHKPGRSIVHGTMLFSTNLAHMSRAITPSRAKLESKQVQSVAQRITTVKELMPEADLNHFRQHLISCMTSREMELNTADIAEIEKLEQAYCNPDFLLGKRHKHSAAERIGDAGSIGASVSTDGQGRITSIDLYGDFFMLADAQSELIERLRGVRCETEAVRAALAGLDASRFIANLPTEELIKTLTNPKYHE